MKLIKHGRNVHELNFDSKDVKIAFLSDVHWDNPKCDHELLKQHLDYCLKHDIKVFLNGDTFCLMQGRGDNRRNKSDIRPEHNNARYLDSIVETAVEWFLPYAHILTVIGYGNHETGIIKYQETDILTRFVDLLNYRSGANVQTGGYGGWLIINGYKSEQRPLHMMLTGTYKEEYGDGDHGWHVERGAPPKPLGGRILTIKMIRKQKDGVQSYYNKVDSHLFNI